tara:strand:- start:189 stop:1214 length:1026 start_codon:yes stop_codon:yes gene_type:complete
MINVKISLPGEKTNSTFENFIDPNSKILKKIKFHINSDIEEADFWFVFEDLYKQQEKCFIDKKNVFYLNTETSFPNSYFLSTYMKEYLNQFHRQYGCYETFLNSYKNTPPFLPWMINYKSGSSIFSKVGKNVNEMRKIEKINKTKKISIICSDKLITDNHKMRYEFAKNLKNYFGQDLDWYGTGVNPIEDKWKGLKDYKYHIVIENGNKNNLISEKLLDSYLSLSFPIYFGAPNVKEYFPSNSIETIKLNNFEESLETIKTVINNDTYENNFNNIVDARALVLGKYNFLNRIANIIDEVCSNKNYSSKSKVVLYNVEKFWIRNTTFKKRAKHTIARKLRLY